MADPDAGVRVTSSVVEEARYAQVSSDPTQGGQSLRQSALRRSGRRRVTLAANSPAINAGDPGALPPDTQDLDSDGNTAEPIPADRAGNDRIRQGGLDAGAFESPFPSPPIHVDVRAGGSNDGSSWADAFTRLQEPLAIAEPDDQIWSRGSLHPRRGRDGHRRRPRGQLPPLGRPRRPGDLRRLCGHPAPRRRRDEPRPTRPRRKQHRALRRHRHAGRCVGQQLPRVRLRRHHRRADHRGHGPFRRDGHRWQCRRRLPDNRGGGLYCVGNGSGNACSPTLSRLVFAENAATVGGAIYAFGDAGESSPIITGSVFAGNTATSSGGAILANGNGTSGISSPRITGSTFAENVSQGDGGALYLSATRSGTSAPALTNVILWGNTAAGSGDQVASNGSGVAPTYGHTLAEGIDLTVAGTGNLDGTDPANDPLFVDAGRPDGHDNRIGTEDDGLRVLPASPVLDRGDNAARALTEDLTGAPRLQDGTVDLGAYEGGVSDPALILYVDADAGGAGDGASWADAFPNVQGALAAATSNEQIWIAAGTYYPDEGPGVTADDRAASFRITGAQDGLAVYGGFAGTETDLSQRDPAAYVTVLSGDIDQNDTSGGDTSANSYHVVVFDGGSGIGPNVDADVTTATVLSGVTVAGGYADGSAANGRGGGLYCDGENGVCSPTLSGLTFAGNAARNTGGAIFNNGENGVSSPPIVNAVLAGNEASQGGAIYNSASGGTSSPAITGATFAGNTAGRGGAMANSSVGLSGAGTIAPVLTNVILWGNTTAFDDGDAIRNVGSGVTLTLRHTLIEGGLGGISENSGSTTIDGGGTLDADPLFADADGPDDAFGTLDDDVALRERSPAIGAGAADALPADAQDLDGDGNTTEPIPFDRAGNDRIRQGALDLGAYESPFAPPLPLHVDAGATGRGDGTSWTDAFTSLQDALALARPDDQIWIAAGTYTPDEGATVTAGDRAASFRVSGALDGLRIYGGFAGTHRPGGGETSLAERDLTTRETILSGDIGTLGDASDNSYHVLVFDGTGANGPSGGRLTPATVLADVTVTGGTANGTSPANRGGGLYCVGGGSGNACSPTLRRIVFAGNTAAAGGAIYAFGDAGESSPVITGSVFTGNTATLLGGAVLANGNNGGASSPVITSSTFAGNDAQDRGGALFASATNGGASAPAFTNALLWGNTATNGGAQVATNGGTPTYAHTLAEGLDLTATGTGNLDGTDPASDPRFVYASAPAGFDGAFGTADDGLRLSLGSPAAGRGHERGAACRRGGPRRRRRYDGDDALRPCWGGTRAERHGRPRRLRRPRDRSRREDLRRRRGRARR